MQSRTPVAICVATFKRPDGLAKLMRSLKDLDTEGLDLQLIVADNDADASGKATFEMHAPDLPFPAHYVVEPTRGLAAVRNRLVAEATAAGAEFMASADDDQTVDPGWVRELVRAAIEFNAAAVAPMLEYGFPPHTSKSQQTSYVGQKPGITTGTPVNIANSGGSLYRISALKAIDGPFDARMNFSGGEDSLLSVQLGKRGEKLIKSSTAIITEHIPASRVKFGYVAKRAWREGSIRAREIRWVDASLKGSLTSCVLFAGYAAKNTLLILPDAIRYRVVPFGRFRLVVFGISGLWHMITGARSADEYAR